MPINNDLTLAAMGHVTVTVDMEECQTKANIVIRRFSLSKSVGLTPFFQYNLEHDINPTYIKPQFTPPKGGVWRLNTCLRCVHNYTLYI